MIAATTQQQLQTATELGTDREQGLNKSFEEKRLKTGFGGSTEFSYS